jgi:hypothetical protein
MSSVVSLVVVAQFLIPVVNLVLPWQLRNISEPDIADVQ